MFCKTGRCPYENAYNEVYIQYILHKGWCHHENASNEVYSAEQSTDTMKMLKMKYSSSIFCQQAGVSIKTLKMNYRFWNYIIQNRMASPWKLLKWSKIPGCSAKQFIPHERA